MTSFKPEEIKAWVDEVEPVVRELLETLDGLREITDTREERNDEYIRVARELKKSGLKSPDIASTVQTIINADGARRIAFWEALGSISEQLPTLISLGVQIFQLKGTMASAVSDFKEELH